ncbi:MAG TPA: replication-relaxation family protein [Galbitalea sp.]|jgi:hypothetical protein|nr:replication-relaxation family protein [Galbitalea sp.]
MSRSVQPEKHNNRAGSIGIRRLRELVTPRDIAILESLAAHRLLATGQVYELHFWSHASYTSGIRACTRVLTRLEHSRFVRRLDRTIGGMGGGSTANIWAIDVAGDRLLRAALDPEQRTRLRVFEPSRAFLDHTLAVADAHIALLRAARAGVFEILDVQTEPGNWRSYPNELGSTVQVKPDLAVVSASEDYEDHWFLEMDRGTESIPTLIGKCQLYERYRASGIEQANVGIFPHVIWLLPTEHRAELLRMAIAKQAGLDPRLFITITTDQLVALVSAGNELTAPP